LWGHALSGALLPFGVVRNKVEQGAIDFQDPKFDRQPGSAVQRFKAAALSHGRLQGAQSAAIQAYAAQYARTQWNTYHVADKKGNFPWRKTANAIISERRVI
jgi:hypothetical protein